MRTTFFALLAVGSCYASVQLQDQTFQQSLQVTDNAKQQYLDELFFCYDLNADGQLSKSEAALVIDAQLNSNTTNCDNEKSLDSNLLNKNASYFGILKQWFGAKQMKLELLYRSSRDGCNYEALHAKVDNKGPTLTVMTTFKGEIFGGYISIPFDKNVQGKKTDAKAFLYSLTREEKYPVKKPSKAYQEDNDYMFGFGKDDLKIEKNCKGSTFYFGEDFDTSPYIKYSTF